jgi:hypothetical protein
VENRKKVSICTLFGVLNIVENSDVIWMLILIADYQQEKGVELLKDD